jgi:hypothetical protein
MPDARAGRPAAVGVGQPGDDRGGRRAPLRRRRERDGKGCSSRATSTNSWRCAAASRCWRRWPPSGVTRTSAANSPATRLSCLRNNHLAAISVFATWAVGLLDLSLGRPAQALDRLLDRTRGPLGPRDPVVDHPGCR